MNKPYSKMNRCEKRAYKRYLAKTNQWDGEIVVENMIKSGKVNIEQKDEYINLIETQKK